jgi:hypothetical protein
MPGPGNADLPCWVWISAIHRARVRAVFIVVFITSFEIAAVPLD